MAKPYSDTAAALRLRKALAAAEKDYAACAPVITASPHKIAQNMLAALEQAMKRGQDTLARLPHLEGRSEQWIDAHCAAITVAQYDVVRATRVIATISMRNQLPVEVTA